MKYRHPRDCERRAMENRRAEFARPMTPDRDLVWGLWPEDEPDEQGELDFPYHLEETEDVT